MAGTEVAPPPDTTVWSSPSAGSLVIAPAEAGVEVESGPAVVGHVLAAYHHYPGETATFHTCLDLREPLADLTLRITFPHGLALGEFQAPPALSGLAPYVEVDEEGRYLVWRLAEEVPAGTRYEFQAKATVEPVTANTIIESRAVLTGPGQALLADETARLMVWAKGRYLRHLPEIYEEDDFMGRFLMLFESFWSPINSQINTIANYFDPRLTPPRMLPWLASWLDLDLDERWPTERQRQLVRWAIALHRSRGTKWGLQKYLELYTGQKAQIIEQRAKNFQLGREARLGPSIALGRGNRPHTFAVNLRLPAMDGIEDEAERARQEQLRRRTIISIIEAQKPAHTVYTLNIEPLPTPAELAAQQAAAEEAAQAQKETVDEIAAQASTWFQLDD
jgi:phage tail-like protein